MQSIVRGLSPAPMRDPVIVLPLLPIWGARTPSIKQLVTFRPPMLTRMNEISRALMLPRLAGRFRCSVDYEY